MMIDDDDGWMSVIGVYTKSEIERQRERERAVLFTRYVLLYIYIYLYSVGKTMLVQ